MTERWAVVGGGAAGVAAAWGARQRGFEVVLYHRTAGATELASGVADLTPWSAPPMFGERTERAFDGEVDGEGQSLTARETAFVRELDYWLLAQACVATSAGVIRPCLARDPAILDLTALEGCSVGVVVTEREDWDGELLARVLDSSPWAVRTHTRFRPVALPWLGERAERRMPPSDFAVLHDDAEWRGGLIERLGRERALPGDCAGLLVGPWLGLNRDSIEELRRATGWLLGECTSPPGAVSGLRFAKSRDRLLLSLGVSTRDERVEQVAPMKGGWHVTSLVPGGQEPAQHRTDTFDGVVLAVGGLVSGGVRFTPRQELGSAFRLGLKAPVLFALDGEPLEQVSSTYGFDPTTAQGTWLERAGVHADAAGRLGQPGLYAAGDVVAGAPRTVLQAVRSGIAAVTPP